MLLSLYPWRESQFFFFFFFSHLATGDDLLYNMLGIHKKTALNELQPEVRQI